jgi:hypothetical protein
MGTEGPEDFLQLQFEWVLAKELGFRDCPDLARYQLSGPLHWNHCGADASDIYPSGEEMRLDEWWGEGLQRTEEVGLIHLASLQPTGAYPDWGRMKPGDAQYMRRLVRYWKLSRGISEEEIC